MRKLKVRDIMTSDVVTVDEFEDLGLADTIMSLARIRHLPVVKDGRLVGLVTHRDILRAQASLFAELTPSEDEAMKTAIEARQIMTKGVATIGPEAPAIEAARLIHERKMGCLPVVEGEKLVGIVTEADFVSLVLTALEEYEADGGDDD